MNKTHYFTSIASNYLPKARILARSLKQHDPDGVIHLVLCDVPPTGFDLASEPFDHLHLVKDLDIPNNASWIFQHELVELCTGAKGPALVKILTEYEPAQVFYFDPDIVVFSDLGELKAELAQASVVLTPHLCDPEESEEAVRHNEITALRHGTYNLGFLGVRPTENGLRFARWWRDRLLQHCWADIPNGLFTDQRWVDLAPALFPEIRILRHRQFNVATWNLTHRKVTLDGEGRLTIDGQPLVFFHFSGFDSGGQLMMLRHYAPVDSPLFELHDWYVREMTKEGQDELGALRCVYSDYFNGRPIPRQHRLDYRSRTDLQHRFPEPFVVDSEQSLYHYFTMEEALAAARASAPPPPVAAEDLTATITWKVGKLLTSPIERAAALVPGLVPAIKRLGR
jgi:hypothetical protein